MNRFPGFFNLPSVAKNKIHYVIRMATWKAEAQYLKLDRAKKLCGQCKWKKETNSMT